MALPNSNISVAMVRDELGASTNDVRRLCIHPNINKWSKWKPVRHNSLTPITQAQLEDVDFGLKPPEPKTDYTLVMDVKWGYLKPTGGLSSPYRLTDFINYNKSAPAIAYVPDPEGIHIDKSTITSRDITLLMNTSESDFLIGLNDFIGDIGDYYYGAVIEERTNRYIITSDKTLANGGFSFTLDFTQSPFDTLREDYTIRHLLISRPSPTIQILGNFGAAYYMSIPTEDGEVNFTEMTVSLTPPSGIRISSFTHVGVSELANYPISNYQSVEGASLQTSGGLYLRAQLTNYTDSTRIFQYPNEIGVSPTFFGDTYRGAIQIYYQGVLKTDAQIEVPPLTTIELVMGNTNLINRKNNDITTPPTGVEIFPVINLYRNNYRISGTTLKLKS